MATDESCPSINALSTDVVANILGYVGGPEEIMLSRVCKKMRDAATTVIVPATDFRIDSVRRYNLVLAMRRALPNTQRKNALGEVTRALPNLQRITIGGLGRRRKYSDGGDANEFRAAKTRRNWETHDISVLSSFKKLRILEIDFHAPLNGRYPFLFNFPLLQKLVISRCDYLKWDLEILSGLPMLKVLICRSNELLSGNINSLRVLKDTLEMVKITFCRSVDGNLKVLADFPFLKSLDLTTTAVRGDVREINVNDFYSLEQMSLPSSVYGGFGYHFQRISDVPAFMNSIYHLQKRTPTLFDEWYWFLSESSPDWYDGDYPRYRPPPFCVTFVQAGSRLGWRWTKCEVNWLDPEPVRGSSEYRLYERALYSIQRSVCMMYKGFHRPPTEEEYKRLCYRFRYDSSDDDSSDAFSVDSALFADYY